MAVQQTLYQETQKFSYPDSSEESVWSHLPPDLIYLISHKLTDIFDFVRFRAVCKTWRSAVRASDLAPQLPWIVGDFARFDNEHLRCNSLLTGKTHVISVPRSSNKLVTGSAYNYLLSFNSRNRDCSLINPLTNEELSLPRPTTLDPNCVPSSMYPGQSLRYIGVAEHPRAAITRLFFCRLGDLNWTTIQGNKFLSTTHVRVGDFLNEGFALYDGLFYATGRKIGPTKVFNLATQTIVYIIPHPEANVRGLFIYLVVSFGEVLRICQYNLYSKTETCYFVIYRLEHGNRDGNITEPCWIKINNIGNQFLLLHEKHGCAFRADDFPGFRGNTIYFTKEVFVEKKHVLKTCELSRYDIKEHTVEVLDVQAKLSSNWFVPSLC